ncbi:MAG: ABC transporter permease [Acidobacteriia bacterium]|nr:ABC transporter permease [Terriglobia bacterium]
MRNNSRLLPLTLYKTLVRAASWFVPAQVRPAWRTKWDSVLSNAWVLTERGELNGRVLSECSRDCLKDVVYGWKTKQELRQLLRSPRFVIMALASVLVVMGILTFGFSGTRGLFRPLPVTDPDRLVWIRYTGSVGQMVGVPPRVLPGWRAHSSLVSGIAAYWRKPFAPHVHATTNFFSVLGAKASEGRLFVPGDRDAAILSDSGRRTIYGSKAKVLGRQVQLEGHLYTIVGVLPDSFWAVSPRIVIWTPLELEPQPDPSVPVLISTVGRIKPGVSLDAVRTDLFNAAKASGVSLPRRPEVVQFTAVAGPELPSYLLGILFAITVGLVIVAKQQPFSLRHSWRYWRFLAAKTIMVLAIPSLAWIEISSAVRGPGPAETLLLAWIGTGISLSFLAAGAFAFWWSFADQRRRCPQCLQLLAMPVTIGSWSSVLDPVTTEFLCESGHGSLSVPETEHGEPDRWTALDASWRELFEKVGPNS